jgi:hypothetical protein
MLTGRYCHIYRLYIKWIHRTLKFAEKVNGYATQSGEMHGVEDEDKNNG